MRVQQIILLFFLLVNIQAHAQSSDEYVTSLKVLQQGEQLLIEYDLKKFDIENYHYEVELEIQYKDDIIYPKIIKGDIGGNNKEGIIPDQTKKRIYWSVLEEPFIKEIIGEIEIRVIATLYAQKLSGPKAAINSLFVPGLGDYKVRKKKRPYYLITAVAYGGVGAGIFNHLSYQDKVKTFNSPNSSYSEVNDIKSELDNLERNRNLFLGIGGAVWLADVIMVGLKGKKNKQQFNQLLATTNLRFKVDYVPALNTYQTGLVFSF